jgi:hypothetical protein
MGESCPLGHRHSPSSGSAVAGTVVSIVPDFTLPPDASCPPLCSVPAERPARHDPGAVFSSRGSVLLRSVALPEFGASHANDASVSQHVNIVFRTVAAFAAKADFPARFHLCWVHFATSSAAASSLRRLFAPSLPGCGTWSKVHVALDAEGILLPAAVGRNGTTVPLWFIWCHRVNSPQNVVFDPGGPFPRPRLYLAFLGSQGPFL